MNTEELLTEREKTHGSYSNQANLSQWMKIGIRNGSHESKRALSAEHLDALEMIIVKISRICTGDPNCKDHWDDIAGYATLGARYVKKEG